MTTCGDTTLMTMLRRYRSEATSAKACVAPDCGELLASAISSSRNVALHHQAILLTFQPLLQQQGPPNPQSPLAGQSSAGGRPPEQTSPRASALHFYSAFSPVVGRYPGMPSPARSPPIRSVGTVQHPFSFTSSAFPKPREDSGSYPQKEFEDRGTSSSPPPSLFSDSSNSTREAMYHQSGAATTKTEWLQEQQRELEAYIRVLHDDEARQRRLYTDMCHSQARKIIEQFVVGVRRVEHELQLRALRKQEEIDRKRRQQEAMFREKLKFVRRQQSLGRGDPMMHTEAAGELAAPDPA